MGRAIRWSIMLSLLLAPGVVAQQRAAERNYPPKLPEARAEVYKQIGDVKLQAYIFEPADHRAQDHRAAVVFFFGGGWRSGTPAQFHQQCKHLAERGMVAITADYRVASRHGVKAVDCVADARSAVRWVRREAPRLGIDPDRIAAAGGSAGGHLAACTALLTSFDESPQEAAVSCVPNALVLFNPALVLAPIEGESPLPNARLESLAERMGVEPRLLSPYHHVRQDAPPTIVFHGKADTTVPYRTAEQFTEAMRKAGNRCELVGFIDQEHGFFNYGRNGNRAFRETLQAMDKFFIELGYLK
ncbi:MAG: alpha/beta hydrolase [Pirellulaceae bacterium]|nr:alpha/beta hydrolase [Pirellulaceae bacterium]